MTRHDRSWSCPVCEQALRYASAPGHLSRADHQVASGSAKYHRLLAAGLGPGSLTHATPGEAQGERAWTCLICCAELRESEARAHLDLGDCVGAPDELAPGVLAEFLRGGLEPEEAWERWEREDEERERQTPAAVAADAAPQQDDEDEELSWKGIVALAAVVLVLLGLPAIRC